MCHIMLAFLVLFAPSIFSAAFPMTVPYSLSANYSLTPWTSDQWTTTSEQLILYNETTATTQSSTHKKPCTYEETEDTGCLNDGSCFALELSASHRMIACSCASGWVGKRCEEREIPLDWLDGASVAGIVVVVSVTVIAVFIIVVVICRKRCNSAARLEREHTETSLMPKHKGTSSSQAETPIDG